MSIAVILPAAGLGRRFGSLENSGGRSKIEMDLAGKPVFQRTVELFLRRQDVSTVVLAVQPDELDRFTFRYGDALRFQGVKVVAGGTKERWETVMLALDAVPEETELVAIHDAVRPMASPALIDRTFEAARRFGAAVPAISVTNTIKRAVACDPPQDARADDDPADAILGSAGRNQTAADPGALKRVVETLDRRELVEIQTPQVFSAGPLREAYRQLADGRLDPSNVTDDAMLIEAMGQTVYLVEGDCLNLKITRPGDLELAEAWFRGRGQAEEAQSARKRLFGDDDD